MVLGLKHVLSHDNWVEMVKELHKKFNQPLPIELKDTPPELIKEKKVKNGNPRGKRSARNS